MLKSQLVRYVGVGLLHNGVAYVAYLGLTWLGADPKLAVAFVNPLSLAISYRLNKSWTFGMVPPSGDTLLRFGAAQLASFTLNILILWVLHDWLDYPHPAVQIFAMGMCAGFLFLAMRYYVFRIY